MTEPTPRQADVLKFTREFKREHGYSPTEREIGQAIGVCQQVARRHLEGLESRGLIERTPSLARSIRICPPYGVGIK